MDSSVVEPDPDHFPDAVPGLVGLPDIRRHLVAARLVMPILVSLSRPLVGKCSHANHNGLRFRFGHRCGLGRRLFGRRFGGRLRSRSGFLHGGGIGLQMRTRRRLRSGSGLSCRLRSRSGLGCGGIFGLIIEVEIEVKLRILAGSGFIVVAFQKLCNIVKPLLHAPIHVCNIQYRQVFFQIFIKIYDHPL